MEGSGLILEEVEVMHLNSDYRHPDEGNLFKCADVTGVLDKYLEEVREKAPALSEFLCQFDPSEQILIRERTGCAYEDRCWGLPEQKGSTSLKNVLSALAPEFAYVDLGVQEGMEAVIAYETMVDLSTPESQGEELRNELLRYCKRDTRSVVEIHRAL